MMFDMKANKKKYDTWGAFYTSKEGLMLTPELRELKHIKIGQTAKAWFFGKNQPGRPLPNSLRVKIMKAVIMPTLTCFGKTRAWTKNQMEQITV